tara:strand:+ start:1942 stop:2304 length:363 start_codon:yes stop_codon:yes gene_type:complete
MWKNLEKFSPSLVRLLARRSVNNTKSKVEAISNQEIAVLAQMPVDRVIEISMSRSWDNVLVKEAQAFCSACAFDPFSSADRNRASAYLRSGASFAYLKKHPHWATFFKPLIVHVQTTKGN